MNLQISHISKSYLGHEILSDITFNINGGEKAKLMLAKIMTMGANFIILDEPTNHLDIPSREAIEEALANYNETLLVVSHDRYFLNQIKISRTVMMAIKD